MYRITYGDGTIERIDSDKDPADMILEVKGVLEPGDSATIEQWDEEYSEWHLCHKIESPTQEQAIRQRRGGR